MVGEDVLPKRSGAVPRTFVIAEAGSCHDRELPKALDLAIAARDAGADAVKYQFWSSADRLAERRRVPDHYREIYRRYAIPFGWIPTLATSCELRGLEFMCSVYLPEDVARIAPFVKRFKIASFEAEDEELLAAHVPFLEGRQMVVSLGMNGAPNFMRSIPYRLADVIRPLHCVSAYPAPIEALNLALLDWEPDGSDDACPNGFDGFSDHSDPALTWTGAIAVAAGAQIIEAHLRLESTDQGNPDAPHAMMPAQFADYVRNIRFAETCLGDGLRQLQACEREMAQYRVGNAGSIPQRDANHG